MPEVGALERGEARDEEDGEGILMVRGEAHLEMRLRFNPFRFHPIYVSLRSWYHEIVYTLCER